MNGTNGTNERVDDGLTFADFCDRVIDSAIDKKRGDSEMWAAAAIKFFLPGTSVRADRKKFAWLLNTLTASKRAAFLAALNKTVTG